MFSSRILRAAAPVAASSATANANLSTRELLLRLEAAQIREERQRKLFALGLFLAAAMTSFMGYNVETIRRDLNDHMRITDERIEKLEQQLRSKKQ
ncbi:hypothetical protein BCR33DRAFT_784812 [Rhizoclosmatium globosum]|uniref:Uncharacterized protein n=1 Tax=Rhizoclosmatium globosum TaxID=329046 RepID=A0A1Y2CCI3_9FUNG|nr:hypothetical protein HDU99_001856 [Rhizoclosmatium hyalinum]ORY44743.1 hypothetical protein BCR33DRAFT_784812 [Rhizoclosmatium globosum]|eukprot:ORY44743.1 hypothetical protein BCR33DRAFT_784812 [Rhizoclosmatium globosum]